MTSLHLRITAPLALLALFAACASDDGGSGGESASTTDATATSAGSTTQAASETASGTAATTGGSDSMSAGSTGETESATDASTTGATATTNDPSTGSVTEATTDATTDTTTDGLTDGTSTDGTSTDGTSTDGTSTDGTSTGGTTGDTTGGGCVPSEEICNDLDDDCDGIIDDVDVGKDGICDCLSIALIGNAGANPSSEFQNWLKAQGTKVDRIQTNANEPFDKAVLGNYDIIILDWLVRSYTAEEAAATRAWIEDGGGLMSMTGHTNNNTVVDRPNSLIKPMGLSYNASKGFFSGPITNFIPHPITEGLTSITFLGGLYVDIVEDGIGTNKIIMTLPQGPVGVVQERKGGRLFIFGDEWVEFDSEWKNIPQIKKFWVQTLAWLGPQDSCVVPQ